MLSSGTLSQVSVIRSQRAVPALSKAVSASRTLVQQPSLDGLMPSTRQAEASLAPICLRTHVQLTGVKRTGMPIAASAVASRGVSVFTYDAVRCEPPR